MLNLIFKRIISLTEISIRRARKWIANKMNIRVRFAVIQQMENLKETSALNATILTGNALNADSSSQLQYLLKNALNAMKNAIS
jgi:hypothetical protein